MSLTKPPTSEPLRTMSVRLCGRLLELARMEWCCPGNMWKCGWRISRRPGTLFARFLQSKLRQSAGGKKESKMRHLVIAVSLLAVVLVLSPGGLWAQAVANATIHGVVTDSTGAPVPNAQVKAIQT